MRLFYYYLFKPKSRGAKCLIIKDDKYLLIKNTYTKNYWNLPGGGCKRNESPEKAIRREIMEELNLSLCCYCKQ